MSPSHNILFCYCYVRTVITSMNTNLIHITTTQGSYGAFGLFNAIQGLE